MLTLGLGVEYVQFSTMCFSEAEANPFMEDNLFRMNIESIERDKRIAGD